MYIMKCDRCGKEEKIKSMLPIFGKEDDPRSGKKYGITALGEFQEITLCPDCEAELEKWIEDYTREAEPRCDNCKYGDIGVEVEPCKSCNFRSNWELE